MSFRDEWDGDGWGSDSFDDGWDASPEGFSDFRDEWGDDDNYTFENPVARLVQYGEEAADSGQDDSFTDDRDDFDRAWESVGADPEAFLNRDDPATTEWEAQDPADDPDWVESPTIPRWSDNEHAGEKPEWMLDETWEEDGFQERWAAADDDERHGFEDGYRLGDDLVQDDSFMDAVEDYGDTTPDEDLIAMQEELLELELENAQEAEQQNATESDTLQHPEDTEADRLDDEDEHRHDTGPGTK